MSLLKYGSPFHPSFTIQLAILWVSLSCVLANLFRVFPWVYTTLGYSLLPVCLFCCLDCIIVHRWPEHWAPHAWVRGNKKGNTHAGTSGDWREDDFAKLPQMIISYICVHYSGGTTRSGVKPARGWILLDHLWFFSLPRHPQLSALIFFSYKMGLEMMTSYGMPVAWVRRWP